MGNGKNDFQDVEPKDFYDFACELEDIKSDLDSKNLQLTELSI